MQKMSEKFVNALSESIATSVLGYANALEYGLLYGNLAADSYQMNGITAQILAHTTAKTAYSAGGNIYDVNAALTLTHLDNILDRTAAYRGSSGDSRMFIASREMISRISALQTRVSRDVTTVNYEGGFVMSTYRGVPLMPSDLLVPNSVSTSPSLGAAASAGGTLPDATRYYAISSVTLAGEQRPSALVSATTATTNNSVTLTWTADPNAKLYYIWRAASNSIGAAGLLAVIPALTYDGSGNVSGATASFIDNGSYTVNTAMIPLDAGEQMFLVNNSMNERGVKLMGAVSPLGDPLEDYVTFVPLATTGPAFRFMMEGFMGVKVPYPTLNAIIRRAKLS